LTRKPSTSGLAAEEITNEWVGQTMKQGRKLANNAVKKIREKLLMSKAGLARKVGVSNISLDKIEKRTVE
jgi:DNA-binding transcriptional regulator YiaG